MAPVNKTKYSFEASGPLSGLWVHGVVKMTLQKLLWVLLRKLGL